MTDRRISWYMQNMVRRIPFSARLVAAAGVLSVLGACAVVPPPTAEGTPFPRLAAEETFASAYVNLKDRFIDAVALGGTVTEGLRGLGRLDPGLTVASDGASMFLFTDGREVARFPRPADDDGAAWAMLTVRLVETARVHSARLRRTGIEGVYEAVFDATLRTLDGFSRYAGAEEARRNRAKRNGFVGVGVRFEVKEDAVVLTEVIPGTPAAAAGLAAGDRIVRIDGRAVAGFDYDQVSARLHGPAQSTVFLTLEAAGGASTRVVELERVHVVLPTVTATTVDGIVVLAISGFNQDTAHSLRVALRKARRELGGRARGVVLDLRGNPGGLLRQSIEVADLFLAQGGIVTTRGRHPDSVQAYDADDEDAAHGLPLAVLVDGGSASAAEIVAAALQDRGRAVVVGTTSFGKGTVQTVIRLPNDGEITLTWSRFVTPSGYALHGLGVRPTVCTSGHDDAGTDVVADALDHRGDTWSTLARWRAVGINDSAGRQALRRSCPAEKRLGRGVDLDVARMLLRNPTLYSRVLEVGPFTAATGH